MILQQFSEDYDLAEAKCLNKLVNVVKLEQFLPFFFYNINLCMNNLILSAQSRSYLYVVSLDHQFQTRWNVKKAMLCGYMV